MNLHVLLGAAGFAAIQGVGIGLISVLWPRDGREACGFWWGMTGWLVWLPLHFRRQAKRRRTSLAAKRVPAPKLNEEWRQRLNRAKNRGETP